MCEIFIEFFFDKRAILGTLATRLRASVAGVSTSRQE